MKKVTEERDCWNKYSERKSETVGDEEELFREEGDRLQATIKIIIITFEDTFPAFIFYCFCHCFTSLLFHSMTFGIIGSL